MAIDIKLFAVMPFSDDFQSVWDCLKECVDKLNSADKTRSISISRADDSTEDQTLLRNVTNQIDSCNIAIIDISSENNNVVFEFGYVIAKGKKFIGICLVIFVLLSLQSCGRSRSPIERLAARFSNVPEYSITLEDMTTRGSLFAQFYHKYKVTIGEKVYYTDWEKVKESFYRQNENYLGMSLLSKTEDGYVTKTPSPPGYQYVGNSRYGEWRNDSSGHSMWAYYGQYMFMSQKTMT